MLKGHRELRRIARAVLMATGSGASEAEIVSGHLVEANLAGHDSHGVGLLPMYVRDRLAGAVKANAHAKFVREDGAIGVFDAGMGFGHVVAREVAEWGIAKAKSQGVAIAAMRNAYHVARLGSYAEQAFDAGLISILFVNVVFGAPRVTPFGGMAGRLHTNPICIGIPGLEAQPPFLLDFATSRIAIGKVRVAYEEGRELPPGFVLDGEGAPSTDPSVLFTAPFGAMLPFGEHKGYGLAVACELLAGALTGGVTYQASTPLNRTLTNSMLAIFIDPARFTELPLFHREMSEIIAHLKSPPSSGVLVAGDPERLSRAKRLAEGIPLAPATWREIVAVAKGAGSDPREWE